MKNLPVILSSLALAGVFVLFGLRFSGNKNGNTATIAAPRATGTPAGGGLRIAYVHIDSFEASYTFLKEKRDAFSKRQDAMKAELQSSAQKLQAAATEFQRKAQANQYTQAEAEAEQKRLAQMDQSLQTRSAGMEEQLLKEQQEFNDGLRQNLDDFLADYNKDKKFDYILSYAVSSPFLYVNPSLDITQDVIKGMNERSSKAADAAKAK